MGWLSQQQALIEAAEVPCYWSSTPGAYYVLMEQPYPLTNPPSYSGFTLDGCLASCEADSRCDNTVNYSPSPEEEEIGFCHIVTNSIQNLKLEDPVTYIFTSALDLKSINCSFLS